jgi:signal transduction histidine kinase
MPIRIALKMPLKMPLKMLFARNFLMIYRSIIIVAIFCSLFLIKLSIETKKSEIIESFKSDSDLIKKSISQDIDYLKYQLFYATSQIVETNSYNNKVRIEKILSSFVGGINKQVDISITWNAFSWVNKNDFLIVDGASGIIGNPVDLKNRDYLKLSKKSPNKLVFGSLVRGILSDRLIIPVAMGVFSYRGDYQGTLVFGLDMERIAEKIKNSIHSKDLEFFVAIENEVIFSSKGTYNHDDIEAIIKKSDKVKNEDNQIFDETKYFNNKKGRLVSVSQLSQTPFKIITIYHQKNFSDQLDFIAAKNLTYAVFVIFVLLLFFQKTYNRIIKPLKDLSKLATKIAKKDFNYSIEKPNEEEFTALHKSLLMLKETFEKEEELIKDLKKSKDELTQTNQAKINLISSISHDIKNYIFGIGGLLEILILDQENNRTINQENFDILKTIKNQVDELRFFVEDLLDDNQVESGNLMLNKIENVDLNQIIKSTIIINHKFATFNKVKISSFLSDDLPMIKADKRRIKQVLLNLINNAIKYSKNDGTIEIKSFYQSDIDQIIIEIIDQGYGMDEYQLFNYLNGNGDKIDKSFIKKDKNDLKSHSIGMKNVIKILKLHAFEIKAESKKDVGTKITLIFNKNL